METLTAIFGLVVIFLWAELHEAIRTRNFKDFGLIHIKLFRDILIDKDGREERFAPFQHFENFVVFFSVN